MSHDHLHRCSHCVIFAICSAPCETDGKYPIANGAEWLCDAHRDLRTTRAGDWSQTFTGRKVYPLDLRPEEVCIEDIAHALALQCRYFGHCLGFLSVAQHSWYVSVEVARNAIGDHALALEALLHDAHEAYLGDTIRPIKRNTFHHVPGEGLVTRKELERRTQRAIQLALGLRVGADHPIVGRSDNAVLATEQRDMMSRPPEKWYLTEPAIESFEIRSWSPERAEQMFLNRYNDLRRLCP